MPAINTNINSLVAQQALTVNERAMNKATTQLSTGKRINSAADDAAGSAIGNRMTAQVRSLDMAVRNANDGISMLQTVDGAASGITSMLQRMRELAVQAVNGSNVPADQTALNAEFSALSAEINHIASDTLWNGTSYGNATSSISFQIGSSASNSTMGFTFSNLVTAAAAATAAGIASATAATSAITAVDASITSVDTYRGSIGATINRLNYAADNLANTSTNTSASRSRIMDTDYAQATTELARTQILQQAGTAMLSQANQSPAMVLALLK